MMDLIVGPTIAWLLKKDCENLFRIVEELTQFEKAISQWADDGGQIYEGEELYSWAEI